MKKIRLYITASFDGYIAPPDGSLEWLIDYPIPSKEDHELFLESVDTVILSTSVYHELCFMDIVWPYTGKTVYIVGECPIINREDTSIIASNSLEKIHALKQTEGKDIWLVGDIDLIDLLLKDNLIDEMIITYVPENLGSGISLFPNGIESKWIKKEEIRYENNAVRKIFRLL